MNKDCQNIKLVLDNDYWTEKESGESYRICDVLLAYYPPMIVLEPTFVPDPSNYRERLNIERFLEKFEPST